MSKNTRYQNETQAAQGERVRQAKQLSKNELARKLVSASVQLEQWVELAMAMAAYYINIEPHADIFTGSTFNESTLNQIRERSLLALKDAPYTWIVYVVDQEDPTKKLTIPVDVVTITDDEQWEQMIQSLNDERDRQAGIERTGPPSYCGRCLFGSSCSESTLKTGLRVYNCGQFVPEKKPEPRTLEHHPDDPAGNETHDDRGDGKGEKN